jgi:hypothetical protein
VEHIEQARRVAEPGQQYREVRYESMKADPVGELQGILEWLDLKADRAACEDAVAACDFRELQKTRDSGALPLPSTESPQGFFRRGQAGGWRSELTRSDLRVIEHICGPLMEELGYELSEARRTRPLKITVHDGVQRVRESIDWQLARALTRL